MPMGAGLGSFLVFLMPISLLLMARRDRGPVARFVRAGALSPQTARRPASLAISPLYLIENAIRRGELVAVGDGRYYVDLAVHRRRRRWITQAALLTTLVAAALVVIIWL